MEEEKKQYMWDVNNDIGHSLYQLRQHRGITAEQFAAAANTTEDKVLNVESGKLPHNIHNLARLVEILGGRLAIVPAEKADDPHCQFIQSE